MEARYLKGAVVGVRDLWSAAEPTKQEEKKCERGNNG